MDIRPIRNDDDLALALKEIDRLWGAPLGTPEGDKIDVIATLVEKYEDERFPVPDSDPVAVLQYAIAEMGRSQSELARLLGSRSRASEILNRRRHMTLEQIRAICQAWQLPIVLLTRHYDLDRRYA